MPPIDLRSDTVTLPSREMRAAMARAPVGDDQYGEDPSVNRLQQTVAELTGKRAALFVPSGTMANQIALKVFTHPGDDVIVGEESHAVYHETGASAANAGVQFTEVGRGGLYTAADFVEACKPRGHVIYPPTTLVEIENTHNRGGGLIFPQADVRAICREARRRDIATYLDGARLFNTSVATRSRIDELARPFDMVSLALSKGLGAPVGTVLAGEADAIDRARRFRRMFGGAMRQAGVIAAAGLYALRHNIRRLAEDHANAHAIAVILAGHKLVRLDPDRVRTNIVVFELADGAADAQAVADACRREGVLVLAFTRRKLRVTTHLNVSAPQCRRAAEIIVRAIESTRTPSPQPRRRGRRPN
jgi:threonine aldolase